MTKRRNMLVYLSHPFTGDETRNRERAQQLAAEITRLYDNVVVVNPLDNFRYAELAKMDYTQVLTKCLALMLRCDAVYQNDEYLYSTGCKMERLVAEETGRPVLTSMGELKTWYRLQLAADKLGGV